MQYLYRIIPADFLNIEKYINMSTILSFQPVLSISKERSLNLIYLYSIFEAWVNNMWLLFKKSFFFLTLFSDDEMSHLLPVGMMAKN